MNKITEELVDVYSLKLKKGDLVKEVEELCGENLFGCYQCGTCSSGCPFVDDMDLTPDEVIRYVILDRKEVLNSKTIWLCASCYTCAERCPRDINITKIIKIIGMSQKNGKPSSSGLISIDSANSFLSLNSEC